MTLRAVWTLPDLVDYAHLLAADVDTAERDRRWFSTRIAPQIAADKQPHVRAAVLRQWLQLRREGEPTTPGLRLRQAESMLATLAWIAGGLAGAALAGAWLGSAGDAPVNAPLFWMVTVGVQLLLMLLGGLAWGLRSLRPARAPGGLPALWQALLGLASGTLNRLPGGRRDTVRAALARIDTQRERHAPLLLLPAAALAQRFGLAFNAGLLAAMLFVHLPLVELRFGWQSTYATDVQTVHRAVQAIATPWRWALPQAQPTQNQIGATRFARGQPAHTLPAEAARAWWPFLVLSIVVYGLLLRGVAWALLAAAQRRRLASLAFDDPESQALWRRLHGPLVQAHGGQAELPPLANGTSNTAAGGDCIALVAQELQDDDEHVRDALRTRLGFRPTALHRTTIDDRQAAAALRPQLPDSPTTTLVIVAPADRDPIVAIAGWLRELAATGAPLLLVLAGADDARLAIWRRFVQIQRLPIGVESWP